MPPQRVIAGTGQTSQLKRQDGEHNATNAPASGSKNYEAKGAATSAFAPALQKIAACTSDVNLLIVGDSTTAKYTGLDQTCVQVDTWGERLPAALAAQYPSHTISTRWYNDGTSTYDVAETLAGTGTRTIQLRMGAVAGKDTGYPLIKWHHSWLPQPPPGRSAGHRARA